MTMSVTVFVLALLEIFAFPIMAFPSNIHELMTSEEIFETFGTTAELIPEYQVFPIEMPASRSKRSADNEIKMSFDLEGKKVNVNFKPTKSSLANKFTPVWTATSDKNAYNKIRYDPLPNAMTDIGNFTMYQDLEHEAAIVVYSDPVEGSVIEGIVTAFYGIKSLPKRLAKNIIKVGDHVVKTPFKKRSVDESSENEMTYSVVFKLANPYERLRREMSSELADSFGFRQRSSRSSNNLPKVVYPEILLVLEHNVVRKHSITQALRFMLAMWNAVDMVYGRMDNPKIKLNIAGFIISMDDKATPYLGRDTDSKMLADVAKILKVTGQYFYTEKTRFPYENYDIVLTLTTMDLCWESDIPECAGQVGGYTQYNVACTPQSSLDALKQMFAVGLLKFTWDYAGVRVFAHETGHIFGLDDDSGTGQPNDTNCNMYDGYVMAAATAYRDRSLEWSQCSKDSFRNFFAKGLTCFNNEPKWLKPRNQILGGRWLSLDGQCQNEGFDHSCTVPSVPTCQSKGCQKDGTEVCKVSKKSPLPGTECGSNMICSTGNKCVKD